MTPAATIRRACLADLDGILAAEQAGFTDEAFSRRQLRYLVARAKGAVFVALRKGRVAGYISLLTHARPCRGRIYSLVVAPEHRGQGLAERLVDTALAFARQEGLPAVFLEVEPGNKAALALYRKKGFVERGLKPDYYHNGEPALSMVRREA